MESSLSVKGTINKKNGMFSTLLWALTPYKNEGEKVEITLDNKSARIVGKKTNKIIPIRQLSGCNMVQQTNKQMVYLAILFAILGIVAIANAAVIGVILGVALAILCFVKRKQTYIELNSSSDRIQFVIDKGYDSAQFVRTVHDAIANAH